MVGAHTRMQHIEHYLYQAIIKFWYSKCHIYEPRYDSNEFKTSAFWIESDTCYSTKNTGLTVQLYLHNGTQLTWIGQQPWCEGGTRTKNKPKHATYPQKNLYLSNSWIHKTTCEDLSSEQLKNLLLFYSLIFPAFEWPPHGYATVKNTACKLFQKEPYLYFPKRLHYNSYTEHFWG